MTPADRVREIAAAANAASLMGKAAAAADLPPEAMEILREFAELPFPGIVNVSTTRSQDSAFVLRKQLCGEHVVSMAVWIEG